MRLLCGVLMAFALGVLAVQGEENPLALQKWEANGGENLPSDWKVKGDFLSRVEVDGRRVLAVKGDGEQSAFWRSPAGALKPATCYRFQFQSRANGAGTVISGTDRVNRDFPPTAIWTTQGFYFRSSEEGEERLRLGQWHLKGQVLFDRVELVPVKPVHATWPADGAAAGLALGEGERIAHGQYEDLHDLGWEGSTIHRTLFRQNAYFNSNRWCFSGDSEVLYLHTLPYGMRNAKVSLNVSYRTSGKLELSASTDGITWLPFGTSEKVEALEAALPDACSGEKKIFVRLKAVGTPANLQVNQYRFSADVAAPELARTGSTLLLEEPVTSEGLSANWAPCPGGYAIRWENRTNAVLNLKLECLADRAWQDAGNAIVMKKPQAEGTAAGGGSSELDFSELGAGAHLVGVRAKDGERVVYEARVPMRCTCLEEAHYGAPLAVEIPGVKLWTCEAPWKVGRERALPKGAPASGLSVELAQGEYEAAQLVLQPDEAGVVLTEVLVSPLRLKGRDEAARLEVELFEVATTSVSVPSDALGAPGEYPDPLPPLQTPLALKPRENQALWVRVHAPRKDEGGVEPGNYQGTLTLKTSAGAAEIPLNVRVFNFELPKSPSLRTGFELNFGEVKRYNRLETPEQEHAVFERYMRAFAAHRLAPYSFFDFAPIKQSFKGEGATQETVLDFTAFDEAGKKYLDELGFNAFVLPVKGLGGGTFYERHAGEFGGAKEGTPEYERLLGDYLKKLEAHLREKGWLSKAYIYWFDEPAPKDFPFVIETMQRLKRLAPGLKRMLTKEPHPELAGSVDLWCTPTHEMKADAVALRRKAGDEFWWYLCTAPKAPYIGLFIDHPSLELRLWSWQTWQFGLQGLLVWETTYWTSHTAFPKTLQDPWRDAMSYVSGYGTPEGTKAGWGNGDGRFFYPPRRDPNAANGPCLDDPIGSLRLENLRDGIEDYEYFVRLKQELERVRGKAGAEEIQAVEALLAVPQEISGSLTEFTRDPRLVLAHRHKLAEAIEALVKIK